MNCLSGKIHLLTECPRCTHNLSIYDPLIFCQTFRIFVQILIPQTYKKIYFVFRIAIAPMWIILARKGITTMGWLAGLDCSNWLALITSRLLSIVEIDHIFSILLSFNLINMTLFYYIILYFNLINMGAIAAIDWLWQRLSFVEIERIFSVLFYFNLST